MTDPPVQKASGPGLAPALWGVFLCGAFLRFWGLSYGLPAVFNADEPHLVDLAVSYGAGGLNPHIFKYPTLWSYLLFAAYGVYYLAWSFFGLWHSVRDFGHLFVWNPTSFYLIARALAAASSCAAVGAVYWAGMKSFGSRVGLWAAAALCVSPALVDSAHAAKPESLLLLFCAGAWHFAFRALDQRGRRDDLLCGLFLGLALTTQYTAAPLWILPLLIRGLRGGGETGWKNRRLGESYAAALGAFFLGTPFAALDYPDFLRNWRDLSLQMGLMRPSHPVSQICREVAQNMIHFAGPGYFVLGAVALGTVFLWFRDRVRFVFLLVPVLAYASFLSLQPEGGWIRYLFPVFPALALVASQGAALLEGWMPLRWQRLLLWIVLVVPGGYRCLAWDRALNLPDTRTLSSQWILSHIPAGSSLLMDQPHASPAVPMSREQVRRLYEKTLAAGHPRSRYYQLLLESHPGGGYQVYRLLRDAADLESQPEHVEWSRKGYDWLDAGQGLKGVKGKVQYVVTTSAGATLEHSPGLRRFFEDLKKDGKQLVVFSPRPGVSAGPVIRIYRLVAGGR